MRATDCGATDSNFWRPTTNGWPTFWLFDPIWSINVRTLAFSALDFFYFQSLWYILLRKMSNFFRLIAVVHRKKLLFLLFFRGTVVVRTQLETERDFIFFFSRGEIVGCGCCFFNCNIMPGKRWGIQYAYSSSSSFGQLLNFFCEVTLYGKGKCLELGMCQKKHFSSSRVAGIRKTRSYWWNRKIRRNFFPLSSSYTRVIG